MPDYATKPLDGTTWPDFARLVEAHNGVWGGCWCLAFHPEGGDKSKRAAERRAVKELRVRQDRAHAALVYDGGRCVGWCQFGVPDELPRIKNRRAYLDGLDELPDWRITCFFVDRGHRSLGVASAGLAGALGEIARLGGGTVESYPDEVGDRSVSAGFLHNGTLAMFERQGFERVRRIGTTRWVVRRPVAPG
jgi:GNAT superfamily N-acetyltransferase